MAYTKPLGGLCVATALFVCAPDDAAPVPPPEVPAGVVMELKVDGDSVAESGAGEPLQLEASGFADTANVTFAMYSEPLELAEVVAQNGTASAAVVTPALPGRHTVVAYGMAPDGGARAVAAQLTITAPTTVPRPIPATGTEVGLWAAVGLALLTAGAALARHRWRAGSIR